METARHRLAVYFAQTMPLIEYYQELGTLVEIDGQREITLVAEAMILALSRENGAGLRA
jgi:adenylate kinase